MNDLVNKSVDLVNDLVNDTISRAAALDCVYGTSPNKIKGRIAELPPAQPVNIAKLQPNCNQVASDCASDCASHCASDVISRQAMINEINLHVGILYDNPTLVESLKLLVWSLPSAQPEEPEVTITYQICVASMLKMWMDDVLTDGEYERIMDKLNAWNRREGGQDERSD